MIIQVNFENSKTKEDVFSILQEAFDFRYTPGSEVTVMPNLDAFDDWMWGLWDDSFIVKNQNIKKIKLIINGEQKLRQIFGSHFDFFEDILKRTSQGEVNNSKDFVFEYEFKK
ncbi:barstar family protein [Candidatus Nomurabacteria bacterium]|nr:barstar family protein [Candidatus Nomurabacteria bacterium]USN94577.1 MAG: barstar family protein [Candidatus Nomurabacteria bacterium]